MTVSAVLATPDVSGSIGRRQVLALAALEARRYARRWSIWVGWAATIAVASFSHPDWAGGSYEQVVPVSFSGLVLGTYVAAVRTGGRDADTDAGPLAEDAPIDADVRSTARLLGLVVPVALAVVTALGMGVVTRIEGGFWLGETPRRTDAAVHSWAELAQPVLLVAIAGAAGVAVGRRLPRAVIGIVLGVFVWTALFPLCWVWNGDALHPLAPMQTMPLRVPLPDVHNLADAPDGWWVESPSVHHRQFHRQWVHQPTVLLHGVYLLGLLAVVAAPSLMTRRSAVVLAGAALVAVGLAGQWLVSPL
jgi:hypothetical protein